ncbi:MAG: 2,3-bisphosphoglycerate-independent phosphoglycerate mutase [Patescibacteria group bacterium]|nr:2,3-bisphosphoglycerate-independent phosphoglycerate mutase [Patescibacteria group bacterium]
MSSSPIVLIILDGWGIAAPGPGNAITQAKLPFFNQLQAAYPSTQLIASGQAVGLPTGEDGNTEVGHINIGAGQIVFQNLPRINTAIADGSFFQNPNLHQAISHVQTNHSTLHLIGLIGSGGVHANNEHLFALIKFAKLNNIQKLSLHLFTDGRDSPPTTSQIYLAEIQKHLAANQLGVIASIMGRYYAMDRDFRWERTEKAYQCLTQGIGLKAISPQQAVQNSYQQQITDEFIEPTVITDNSGTPLSFIKDNDAVIFFNFRVDRPRQLTKAFVLPDFSSQANQLAFDPLADRYLHSHLLSKASINPTFHRQKFLTNLFFLTMTEYQANLPAVSIIPPLHIEMPLSRILSEANLKQLKISETEKERFVTYYFNGLREQPFEGEDWLIIPSPKIATYDLQPAMSTPQLTADLIDKLKSKSYQFIAINIACVDMVSHTGNLTASIQACETVDAFLSQVIPAIISLNGTAIITADHGNAEELINLQTGQVDTEHSANPVPCIIAGSQFEGRFNQLNQGILADVAPTILKLLNLPKPSQMTGTSLI